MEEICRLCCSNKFVNNNIFDEENALYLKMSLYLPIKVFKNDRLPQKVCDRCSCKVNDFYQFCNETIEVQNRLRAVLLSTTVQEEDSIDLSLIKHNSLSPTPSQTVHKTEPSESTYIPLTEFPIEHDNKQSNSYKNKFNENLITLETRRKTCDQTTQTGSFPQSDSFPQLESSTSEINSNTDLYQNVHVKEEPKPQVESQNVKTEDDFPSDDFSYPNLPSDNSEDDMSLLQFKKKKSKKVKVSNGKVEKKKRKKNLKEWEMLMRALPEGTALTVVDPAQPDVKVDVKQELEELELEAPKLVKQEPVEFHCCVCFVQCYSRGEMLAHYREHAAEAEALPPPPAPPAPADQDPIKCTRCQKRVERGAWPAHWQKHWERDRRPYRCALCEKTFRDHHQILKHGLTHKWGEEGEPGSGPDKRFVCDLCPEGFVYMRYLLSHRARAHPEAAARALTLRCALCTRQFAHLNSLRRHLRAHTGERNFLCNICGKALSSREHLKFHIRIHTGYKPNVCKTCGKGFVKKCNLTLHERVHSGERPHVCPHCGKAFSQRSTLVIHERYHSGARPYVCPLCSRGFVAKGLLSMHLKTTCI